MTFMGGGAGGGRSLWSQKLQSRGTSTQLKMEKGGNSAKE